MLQQNIWHIAEHQDNKNHPKFVQTATFIVIFLLGINNSNLRLYLQIPIFCVLGTLFPKHNFKETLTKHPTLNNIYETINSKQDKTKNL